MTKRHWAVFALGLGLAACDGTGTGEEVEAPGNNQMTANEAAPTVRQAVATLQTAEGTPAGSATATADDGGVILSLRAEGLPPGQHGAHVHAAGRCDPPGFESAGSHWNPLDREHGLENPQGQHAGDMPNLVVGEDGRGTLEYRLEGGSLDALLEGDGSAMVIHASADDQRTDPSGNSGARIACGIFAAG